MRFWEIFKGPKMGIVGNGLYRERLHVLLIKGIETETFYTDWPNLALFEPLLNQTLINCQSMYGFPS